MKNLMAANDSSTSQAPSKPATIYDVAALAGVSHATVTRLLKGFEGIRPDTRARVEHALATLDYRPNMTARSLITGQSHRIGALTHEIDQVGPSRIVQGAAAAARKAGFVLDIISLDMTDSDAIEESLNLITQHDLAGLIVLSSTDEMRTAFEQTRFRVPVHFSSEMDGVIAGPDAPLDSAMEDMVSHLAGLGHTHFFHIAGAHNWTAARNRELAFHEALGKRGLHSTGVGWGDWSPQSGFDVASSIPQETTAVIAANDQMALGAMLSLKQRGIAVPSDMSVTGIDDIPESAFFDPPLTTVHLDFVGQGATALAQLLELISPDRAKHLRLPRPSVVLRASSAQARSAQHRDM